MTLSPCDMSVRKSWFWVDWNSGPIFHHLWTNVHQIWKAYMEVIAVCSPFFRSTIPCFNLETSAMKSQNGVVEKYVFRPQNFWGEGPPKSDADVLCPKGDTSSRKVWCNSPNRSRRYQPMYTRILPNFWISCVKKLLGADPSAITCALASVGHPLPTVEFLGGNAP